MDLSVIIVSYNVRKYLSECLLSVRKASEGLNCEIIVVDNNSEDGSAEMIMKEFPEVRLIINTVNSGFAAANNKAIRLSAGKYILLLNPDTLVGTDTFSLCLDFMKNHPDAGALGVRMISGDGKFLPESKRAIPTPLKAFYKISGLSALFPDSKLFNGYYLPDIDSTETSVTEAVSGAFMFLNKDSLAIAGLLDEDFFMYGEDIDLSYRIMKAGFTNYYYPEVQIVHYKGRSTTRNGFTDISHFYRAMRIYSEKRNREDFTLLYYIIIPAIWLRQFCSVFFRFLNIVFSK
jgi:GT2 family glycosyltransferase